MKKISTVFLLIIFLISGCKEKEDIRIVTNNVTSVKDVLNEKISEAENTEIKQEEDKHVQQKIQENEETCDIDLTVMSSTMVYSEVNNMMNEPENYIGKTIKMNGEYQMYENLDKYGNVIPEEVYYVCIIADATACCAQGVEFVLCDGYSYPEPGETITVSGRYELYEEKGHLYCHLVDAVMY